MFDQFAQELFDHLPDLPGLNPEGARRTLSQAYLAVVQLRTDSPSDSSDIADVTHYLRRLAHTLEFYAVLDDDAEQTVRQAGAFITGESLALLAEIYDQLFASEEQAAGIRDNGIYTRIESALLYLIAGYDANAAGVLNGIGPAEDVAGSPGEQAAEWCLDVLIRLCRFELNPLPARNCPVAFGQAVNLNALDLEDDTVGRLYGRLGEGVTSFTGWLVGERPNGIEDANVILDDLLEVLGPREAGTDSPHQGLGGDYARVRHLAALLRIGFSELSSRSVIHLIPTGPGFSPQRYDQYLKYRSQGDGAGVSGRPVLWPSAKDYIENCVLGDYKHAVVSMPTGSGKSFVAELAVSQSVGKGWVLYLAPTNALTEQIRGDLIQSMKPLQTQIFAFIGDREYSVLKTEVVSEMPENSVAVMTPEKASLALRLYPEVFQSCKLVVFDECHLLGEVTSGRGVTAELLMSSLMLRSPEVRILLMSAIVQNPDDLAGWLTEATGQKTSVMMIPWRPTRTLRSALGVDGEAVQDRYRSAREELAKLPLRRKNKKFLTPSTLVCSLQGAWQSTDQPDYGRVKLLHDVELKASRTNQGGEWKYGLDFDPWVNKSTISLASLLSEQGIQTLAFTPANRHHPFSNASNTNLSDDYLRSLESTPSIIRICEVLSECEFGASSPVFELLAKGISVHTSHMIEVEKIASEVAFRSQSSRLMYATGTLAQGLNLPATAVVIAGTRIGYSPQEPRSVVERRKRSQLLNAAGRAGRAGFANQGLVIAVPDKPVLVRSQDDVNRIRMALDYLQEADNAVEVESALDSFMDQVSEALLNTETSGDVELQAIAVLSGGDEGQPDASEVLKRTYASYRRKLQGHSDVTEEAGDHLDLIREEFLQQNGAPDWVPIAAQRAGLDYFLTVSLAKSWASVRPQVPVDVFNWTVFEWVEELLRVVANIPLRHVLRYMPPSTLGRASSTLKESAQVYSERSFDLDHWQSADDWVNAWMNVLGILKPWMEGRPIVDIAAILTSTKPVDVDIGRNSGSKPIPKTLSLINDFFSRLALLAGGLVAVAEQLFNSFAKDGHQEFDRDVPLPLSSLPMCIKYGCDSPQSLAWYRFGVRLRRPARLLHDAFPPPTQLGDEQLRVWVTSQRSAWLNGHYDRTRHTFRSNESTFDAIADFLRQD